ncbi:MAG: nucleoside triphosphate pyrophosphohydrolase family protein [Candidatus Saccharibacteria bacterium]|nr:nucleoside triphosphate pyrophosphohydrolase family protein [Candidatus Saccharibacteria bacterium]
MTFDEYQKQALTTAIFNPDPLMDKTIWAMGIVGEAGEVIEKWKKIVAYRDGNITDEDVLEIKKELGDVVWYIAMMAHSLNLSLDDVMQLNLDKLASRKTRGVQKGHGDNR